MVSPQGGLTKVYCLRLKVVGMQGYWEATWLPRLLQGRALVALDLATQDQVCLWRNGSLPIVSPRSNFEWSCIQQIPSLVVLPSRVHDAGKVCNIVEKGGCIQLHFPLALHNSVLAATRNLRCDLCTPTHPEQTILS